MRASTFHPATLDLLDEHDLTAGLITQGTRARQWQYWIHGTDTRALFDLGVLDDLTAHLNSPAIAKRTQRRGRKYGVS